MLVLTRAPPSSVFIYSPGSLSIITRLAVDVHIIITRHVSVTLPMFVCNVISGHFNPIHFTNMSLVMNRLWRLLTRGDNNEAYN